MDAEILPMENNSGGVFTVVWFKFLIFMVLLFLLLNSEIFLKKVLEGIHGAVEYDKPTWKGSLWQAGMMAGALTVIYEALVAGWL